MTEEMADGNARDWSFNSKIICVPEKETRATQSKTIIKTITEL